MGVELAQRIPSGVAGFDHFVGPDFCDRFQLQFMKSSATLALIGCENEKIQKTDAFQVCPIRQFPGRHNQRGAGGGTI